MIPGKLLEINCSTNHCSKSLYQKSIARLLNWPNDTLLELHHAHEKVGLIFINGCVLYKLQ